MVSSDKSQQFRNIILNRYQTRNEKPPETRPTSTLMTQDLFIAQANMIENHLKLLKKKLALNSKRYANCQKNTFQKSTSEINKLLQEFDEEIMTNIHSYEQEIKNLETQIDGKQNTFKNQIYQTIVLDLYETFKELMSTAEAQAKNRVEQMRRKDMINNASTRPLPLIPISQSNEKNKFLDSLSEEETSRLLRESCQIQNQLATEVKTVQQLERHIIEISEMTVQLSQHIAEQHDIIDIISKNAEITEQYVEKGNESLQQAKENMKSPAFFIAFFFLLLSFLLLIMNRMFS